jgi:hypothetical protein
VINMQQDHTKILKINAAVRSELTDAQLVASWAAEALELGRYPLGAELARLAERAERIGAQRPAGHDATHDAARRDLFGPATVRDVPLIGATREEWPRDGISHAPRNCTYRTEINGSARLCHQPLAWHAGSIGDESTPPSSSGWYHLDPEITDHIAEVAGY